MRRSFMKRSLLTVVVLSLLIAVGSLTAQTLVDKTGTDFQSYWYVEGHGQQLVVDENGTVHAVYTKTWCTASDTGYQVMYANVTDGTTMEVPSQEPDDPVQPGVIFIGGGHGGTPVYMYYGAGSRMYSYADDMHNQAIAKLSADGSSIEGLGVQEDQMYYASAHYANPIEMVVDNVNGIVHVIQTNPGGHEIGYWNFDGTNFGECYNLYGVYADAGVPGKSVPGNYRGNPTKGADIDVTSDGSTVMVVGLHPATNIMLHKGDLGGNLWADDFFLGLDDGSVMCVFDTTGSTGAGHTNFSDNNAPKPFSYIGMAYDANDKLHMVFDCAYQDIFKDTTTTTVGHTDNWAKNYLNQHVGDLTGCFFDGTEHPKEQLRYWNEDMGVMLTDIATQTTLLAECDYPMAGDTFEWFSYGEVDSGPAMWGKYWDGLVSNIEFIANADPQEGEPLAVVAWEEMGAPAVTLVDTNVAFFYNYMAFTHDVKVAKLTAEGWSNPVNLTNSPEMDETGITLYNDVIDNHIHMMWYADPWPGRDRIMVYQDDYESGFVTWAPPSGGHFSVPIRNDEATYANIYYQAIDLTTVGIEPTNDLAPVTFDLAQNFPNPFNPTTSIRYTVPSGNVNLTVYDLLGQKVRTLVNKDVAAGAYEVNWDGTNAAGNLVSSGVYFYKLTSDAGVISKKMLLQR